MKHNRILGLNLFLVLLLFITTSCGTENESIATSNEPELDIVEEEQWYQENEIESNEDIPNTDLNGESLSDKGLSISNIELQDNGFTIVVLYQIDMDETFYGILNPEFEWVLNPTNEIINIFEFHDGLVAAEIEDTRELNGEALVGYINEEGEWQIEPQFRRGRDFSEGVAIVKTIEEDRDDLSNAREIVIDKSGKQIGEIISTFKSNDSKFSIDWYAKFINGYYISNNFLTSEEEKYTIFDTTGASSSINFLNDEDYLHGIVNETLIVHNYETGISFYTFDGELKHQMADAEFLIDEEDSAFFNLLQKGFVMLRNWNEDEKIILVDLNENNTIKEREFDYGDNYNHFINNMFVLGDDVLDLDGNLIYKFSEEDNDNSYSLLHYEMMFEEGVEYIKLVDISGNELIGEDIKIIDYQDYSSGPIVEIRYRAASDSTELVDALLNVQTLDIIPYEEIENKLIN